MARARVVLWDFDGPICRLFAGHSATRVAAELVEWLEVRGLHGLLAENERGTSDPHAVLRAVNVRHPDGDLVAELEQRLTAEEIRAVRTAMPTAYADPLIRTWTATGARLAITTNNSPRAACLYLTQRDMLGCFHPHIYGRTQDLHHLKPDPHFLGSALDAMGSEPSDALMIGDSPSDHTAALRAGVPFLGYARNERKAKLLGEAGAEVIVGSLEPLLRAVRSRA
ncbi:HAD family hydrolase [Streptomyces caeruleatus]|uniref:HAD family hydrolase n=1 Tax=Streptomyces caeruleatus TaxID=661399 RepID=A0A101TMC3_9ACTN|nr:HAD family hydrolase [Streptomyces caeruleatus]